MTNAAADAQIPKGRNAIWEALTVGSRRMLEATPAEVDLEAQQLLSAEEEGVEGLYFPLSGVICRLVSLPEGTTVKVSLVGREGMVGSPALVDATSSAFRTVVQLPGRAIFVPRSQARRLFESPPAAQLLFRYELLLLRETSLTAACNRVHTTRQRLARWLLLIRDRGETDEFPLTHESLSAMLGVRRESVTLAAKDLRRAATIEYRRATVAITNRSALERQSCSCYRAITDDYGRFLESEVGNSQQR